MNLASAIRYRGATLREDGLSPSRHGVIDLAMKRPVRGRVRLREPASDIHTFREVMIAEIYSGVVGIVPRCRYILDLGANVGLTTLYLSQQFPDSQIISVEPDTENLRMLRVNLACLLPTDRCQVVEAAAWGEDTTLSLSLPPENTSFDSITVSKDSAADQGRSVAALRVDTLMERHGLPYVDILKIDVEGAETDLFRRDPSWIDRVNAISIEFHGNSRAESGFDEVAEASGLCVIDDQSPNTVLAYRDKSRWLNG